MSAEVALPWRATSRGGGLDFADVLDRQIIRLVSANYLLKRPPTRGFGRMQDLPEEAFISPTLGQQLLAESISSGQQTAGRDRAGYNPKSLIIVSYPWLDKDHPDPHGHHLRTLQGYLASLFASRLAFLPSSDAGVFVDFMCLPQAPRTDDEAQRFRLGLSCMHALYSHSCTVVLQLKDAPGREYNASGWCVFEQCVASVFKDHNRLLDLSLVGRGHAHSSLGGGVSGAQGGAPRSGQGWAGISTHSEPRSTPGIVAESVSRGRQHAVCVDSPADLMADLCGFSADGSYATTSQGHPRSQLASTRGGDSEGPRTILLADLERQARAHRQPPMHPNRFDQTLGALHFTNGADRDVVASMYRQFYDTVTAKVTKLNLRAPVGGEGGSADWGASGQVEALIEGLCGFVSCHTLLLDGHCFDDKQVDLLLPALSDMRALKRISLVSMRSRWTAEGKAHLLAFCESRGVALELLPGRKTASR